MAKSINLFHDQSKRSQGQFVEGQVSATFFKSPDSFYRVLLIQITKTNLKWHQDQIVVTGNFGEMDSNRDYRFLGHLIHHPKYGDQFKAISYSNDTPTSRKGLVAYLSGKDFPGVGEQTAKKVVDQLGENLIEVVLSRPQILNSLGISARQAKSIHDGIENNDGIEQIIIGLNSYGFGSRLASTIFNHYHEKTLQVIQRDPYRLVKDVRGVNFKKADQIAKKIGITQNSPARLRAGLLTALRQLTEENGDVYTTTQSLMERSLSLLNQETDETISGDELAHQLVNLAKQHQLVGDGSHVYLNQLYRDEWTIAQNLARLQNHASKRHFSNRQIQAGIRRVERRLHINYDDSQVRALEMSVNHPLFLLSGGPGTGITTIIVGIVFLFADLNHLSLDLNQYHDRPYPVLLAAPTGRAAKRMNESTHLPASTIHRLLGLNSYDQDSNHDPVTKELAGQILIIDEMSMVDTELFRLLVDSVPNGMKVILVGDKDQLPSVGPGQVFSDLLSSKTIPKLGLTTIHRQSANSTIIPLAHCIRKGRLPRNFTDHEPDRSFIACTSAQLGSVIRQIVTIAKQKGFNSTDMQVLAPMYRGEAGINHLNAIIQEIMNPLRPGQQQIEARGMFYRVGDKVLQLVNSPENDIFNGDIGQIVGLQIDSRGRKSRDKITIAFDQSEVTYKRDQWGQITLAYCTSIHKAQGSEFKMVILPMVPQYYLMLKRNLLYTAVSRASKALVLIGDYNSFEECVENESINRNTTLASRLRTLMKPGKRQLSDSGPKPPVNHVLTVSLIQSHQIDPMIGMKGISPFDFMTQSK